jgi:hypothetical protein
LSILIYLTNCLYDCKAFHEEISARLEDKASVSREKNELVLRLRSEEAKLKALKGSEKSEMPKS